MICPNCHMEVDGNLNFCSNCGKKLPKFKRPSEIDESTEEKNINDEALEIKLNNLLDSKQNVTNSLDLTDVNNKTTSNNQFVYNSELNNTKQPIQSNNFTLNTQTENDSVNNSSLKDSIIPPAIPNNISVPNNNETIQSQIYHSPMLDNNNPPTGPQIIKKLESDNQTKVVYKKPKKLYKILIIIGLVLLLFAFGIMIYEYFKESKTGYQDNIDILTEDEIYNGITMGKYYEVNDEKELEYVSTLEFNRDGTFKFNMNLCSGLVEMTGTYEVSNSRAVLTLDDIDSEGNKLNTKLSFVVIDENRMWLETEFGCITTGMNSGTFVYRQAR